MIAIGAVLSDWPSGSVPLQSYQHVLDELPYPLVLRVSRSLACGSMAAAPAVLAIRRVVHRSPSWSWGCWMRSCRSSSRSGINAIPTRRRVCCKRFVPAHQRPRPAPAGGGDDASTRAGSPRHGERVQPGLTQRDMWVMHRGVGEGGGVSHTTTGRSITMTRSPHFMPAKYANQFVHLCRLTSNTPGTHRQRTGTGLTT